MEDDEATLVASLRALSPRPCESLRMLGNHLLQGKKSKKLTKEFPREIGKFFFTYPPNPFFFAAEAEDPLVPGIWAEDELDGWLCDEAKVELEVEWVVVESGMVSKVSIMPICGGGKSWRMELQILLS